jgi:hypothetical protein
VQRNKVLDDWSRVDNSWILVRGGKATKYSFSHTIYSGVELRESLFSAGFQEVRLYGGLDGRPYGRGAERLVAVARKRL